MVVWDNEQYLSIGGPPTHTAFGLVDLAAQDVVAAGGEADQVGPHRQGGLDLLGDHPVQQPAADRQIRVPEVGPRVDRQPEDLAVQAVDVAVLRGEPATEVGALPEKRKARPPRDRAPARINRG